MADETDPRDRNLHISSPAIEDTRRAAVASDGQAPVPGGANCLCIITCGTCHRAETFELDLFNPLRWWMKRYKWEAGPNGWTCTTCTAKKDD